LRKGTLIFTFHDSIMEGLFLVYVIVYLSGWDISLMHACTMEELLVETMDLVGLGFASLFCNREMMCSCCGCSS
jgi:hypothetical protein